ncbi:hypothetical protein N9X61_00235 [Sulfurimonas sp.]|nr:hypothetical protein [Sulfurimonas sp.]
MLEKFKNSLKKEMLYYLVTFLILTLVMHSDLLSDPITRFELMQEKGNYSHPFIYTFVIYAVMFILRKAIDFISSLFEKK